MAARAQRAHTICLAGPLTTCKTSIVSINETPRKSDNERDRTKIKLAMNAATHGAVRRGGGARRGRRRRGRRTHRAYDVITENAKTAHRPSNSTHHPRIGSWSSVWDDSTDGVVSCQMPASCPARCAAGCADVATTPRRHDWQRRPARRGARRQRERVYRWTPSHLSTGAIFGPQRRGKRPKSQVRTGQPRASEKVHGPAACKPGAPRPPRAPRPETSSCTARYSASARTPSSGSPGYRRHGPGRKRPAGRRRCSQSHTCVRGRTAVLSPRWGTTGSPRSRGEARRGVEGTEGQRHTAAQVRALAAGHRVVQGGEGGGAVGLAVVATPSRR